MDDRPASAPVGELSRPSSSAVPTTPLVLVRYVSDSSSTTDSEAERERGDASPPPRESFSRGGHGPRRRASASGGGRGPRRGRGALPFSWRALAAHAGPGLLVATAYLDPGNLEACIQAASTSGYSLLWVLASATAAGGAVQVLAVRLGVGAGADLARLAGAAYGRRASLFLWAATQAAITGADVQALAGCAVALGLLSAGAIPPAAGVGASAAASLAVLAATTHARAGSVRALEGVFAVLVGALGGAALTLTAVAPVDWRAAARGLAVPSLPPGQLPAAAAIVGSVLMGHNLFLHSACVQSRQPVQAGRRGRRERRSRPGRPTLAQRAALTYFALESGAALTVAGLICAAVIAVFSTAPPGGGGGAAGVGLAGAGAFLSRRYSPALAAVWGVGVLAAGQSAAMAGAYAAQHVASGFGRAVSGGGGWVAAHPAAVAGLARAAAVAPALAIALSGSRGGGGGAAALDAATQALNVVQALQLPFALVPLIRLAASPAAAGGLAAGRGVVCCAAAIAAAVLACNAGVAAGLGRSISAAAGGGPAGGLAAAAAAGLYAAPLAWLALAKLDEAAIGAAREAAAAEARAAVEAALGTTRPAAGGDEEGGGRADAPLLGGE